MRRKRSHRREEKITKERGERARGTEEETGGCKKLWPKIRLQAEAASIESSLKFASDRDDGRKQPTRESEPACLSYSKVALSLFCATGPRTPHQVRDAVEINVYQSLSVPQWSSCVSVGCTRDFAAAGFLLRAVGPTDRYSARRDRPVGRHASTKDRGVYPRSRRRITFSILTRVVRLTKRAAPRWPPGMGRRRRA